VIKLKDLGRSLSLNSCSRDTFQISTTIIIKTNNRTRFIEINLLIILDNKKYHPPHKIQLEAKAHTKEPFERFSVLNKPNLEQIEIKIIVKMH